MNAPRFIVLAAVAAALSACATKLPPQEGLAADARTPTELWKANVTSAPEEIRLAIHAQGVSQNQVAALAEFSDRWRAAGGGEIILQAPVGGPEVAATSRASEGVRAALTGQGASNIRVVGYDAKGDPRAPLILGYLAQSVSVPECGRTWTNIAHSAQNEVQPNFGCAVTANMAAQIANPADLLGPAPSTPADAQRRSVVLEKYRKGEITSSAKDAEGSGTVSQAVGK